MEHAVPAVLAADVGLPRRDGRDGDPALDRGRVSRRPSAGSARATSTTRAPRRGSSSRPRRTPRVADAEANEVVAARDWRRAPPGWEPPAALRRERVEPSARRVSAIAMAVLVGVIGIWSVNRAWEARNDNPNIAIQSWARVELLGLRAEAGVARVLGDHRRRWARCRPDARSGSRRRCGSSDPINYYGTSLALELLPYWTKGRIGSMEGLYFESSATTSFHFLTVSELAAHPSNPVRGLVYGSLARLRPRREAPADARRPLLHGVDAGSAGEGRREPRSRRRSRRSPTRDGVDPKGWKVYEVAGSELVQGLDVRTGGRADARGHDVVVLRAAPADRRHPRSGARRVGVHGRGLVQGRTICSTRRGRRSGPEGVGARRRGRSRRPRRARGSTRSKVTEHHRGRRPDRVPRRQGRRAGRREGVVLPELGGARRRRSVPARAEPDGRHPDASTTCPHLRPDPGRLARPHHHARRIDRSRRPRRCGRAHGATARTAAAQSAAARPTRTTTTPPVTRWARRPADDERHRHHSGRNRPRRYHDRCLGARSGGDRSHRDVSLDAIFKAYDIRGIYPDEIDETARAPHRQRVRRVHGRVADRRRPRHAAVVAAARRRVHRRGDPRGADVTDIGLCSTDLVYFASGRFDAPGAMFTASHNPAQYNGIKLCRAGAAPVGEQTGLVADQGDGRVRRDAPGRGRRQGRDRRPPRRVRPARAGRSSTGRRAAAARRSSPTPRTAWAASSCPRCSTACRSTLTVLFGELDGTFPNHPADPIQVENLKDLQRAVVDGGADVGLAFDGDADRVFLVDDLGQPVSGSTTTAIVAKGILEKHPGETIVYNLICSKAVPEIIRENGGTPVRTRVGHSFIKQVMAETGAIFGGEHSAHYYFRDNWRADSGSIAALFVLEQLSLARRAALRVAQAVRALRAERRDQHARRRSARGDREGRGGVSQTASRTASTGSPSTAATGGSTCGRATPSRCCG